MMQRGASSVKAAYREVWISLCLSDVLVLLGWTFLWPMWQASPF